jgi:hypothetical protein
MEEIVIGESDISHDYEPVRGAVDSSCHRQVLTL